MAYSELIKSFDRIREYMRQFYVYGFKSRSEYDMKSARSYDNERRRVQSWLGDYMRFHQEDGGKEVYLSVDSRSIVRNPLHQAFRAKSFTDGDITLHFILLDLLHGDEQLSIRDIIEGVERHMACFETVQMPDESTIRKKLKEYEKLGLITSMKNGRELVYCRATDRVPLDNWKEAATFFSEADPLGVIGASVLDRMDDVPEFIRHKHHYILGVLDSEVLGDLLMAIGENRAVDICVRSRRSPEGKFLHTVFPCKIYAGTESGRQYLLCYHYKYKRLIFHRMDNVLSVKPGALEKHAAWYHDLCDRVGQNLWGVSIKQDRGLDHLEMTLRLEEQDYFIVDRLEREKRCGTVTRIDEHTVRFVADVHDATEMLPWLRTFTGRIENLTCTDQTVVETFYADLDAMAQMYGGEADVS